MRVLLVIVLIGQAALTIAREAAPNGVFVPAKLIKQVDVRPPKWGIGGYNRRVVEACFVISTDGKVKDVTFTDPNRPDFLDIPIKRALVRWRFEPATRGGVPVEQRGCYEVQIRQLGG